MTQRSDPSPPRRGLLALAGSALLLGAARPAVGASAGPLAQAPAAPGANPAYQPQRGQAGKDVVWIATPDRLVTRMLRLAAVTPQDFVIDLGSGDGKIVIAAAREFGARGLGIEYNPDLVELSRRNAAAAGVADRARFEKADIFQSDFSAATVVTMYLLPHLNIRLRHVLMALRPGTRLVSHDFNMGNWEPDESSKVGTGTVHLWLVPANAGGRWRMRFPQRAGAVEAMLDVEQVYQKIRGRAVFEGFETTLRDGRVSGDTVAFALTDEDGRLRRFEGRVYARGIEGTVRDGDRAEPFVAERLGVAPPIMGSEPATGAEIYESS